MLVEVEIVEGGKWVKTEKMDVKLVKEFSNGIKIYETDDGEAVLYSGKDKKYTLVSIDIA
jgi:hypothetical protein